MWLRRVGGPLRPWADEAEQGSPYERTDTSDWDRRGQELADLLRAEVRGRYLVGYFNRESGAFDWA